MEKKYKNFKHKHSLGQNFINDEFILDDMVKESAINKNDYVLEIGSGNGALTKVLSENAKHVITIEIDKTILPLLNANLEKYKNVSILNADFLTLSFSIILNELKKYGYDFLQHIKVVANLPYYITSPIINSLLLNKYISSFTIMVQKEVGERIIAVKNNKNFGVLTLLCNYFANTKMLFIVPKECFFPIPKVDSAIIKFDKYNKFIDLSKEYDFETDNTNDFSKLFKFIKSAFTERRKKLVNSLSDTLNLEKTIITDALNSMGINNLVRAENLDLDEYKTLYKLIFKNIN